MLQMKDMGARSFLRALAIGVCAFAVASSAWAASRPPVTQGPVQPPSATVNSASMARLAALVVGWRSPGFVNVVWDLKGDAQNRPAVWPVVRPARMLACAPQPRVSAQVKQDFSRLLAQSGPVPHTQLVQAMGLDWLQAYREGLAQPYGLQPDNVADSLTAYMVSLWAMVNRTPGAPIEVVQQLRNRMREAILAQPGLAMLGCEARQRINETLIYNTVLLVSQRYGLQALSDEAGMQAAVAHYRQVAKDTLQVDVLGMRLEALSQ